MERSELITIGANAEIKDYVIIRTYEGRVTIGAYVQLNPFTVIYGGNVIHIGNNVMIAPHCMIAAGNHDYVQTDVPMRFAGNLTKGPIVIEDNVWIGANSTVTDGVRIGREAVVAANSLVNKDVEPYTIVGGVPAKEIGRRKPKSAQHPTVATAKVPIDSPAFDVIGHDEDDTQKNGGLNVFPRRDAERSLALLFSRNRAMQLDCTLQSLYLHCRDIDRAKVKVIYTTSSDVHEQGYRKTQEHFPSADFVREKEFKGDLLSALTSYDYIMFLVDDNIFVRDFNLADVKDALVRCPSAMGFSLRLGRNTTYCYMLDKEQRVPAFDEVGKDLLGFDWTISEYDFGYPLEVSSSVYRVSDILPLVTDLSFSNPNTLEALLDASKDLYRHSKPLLLCYGTSVTFCNPVNKVQNVCVNNRTGRDNRYAADSLAEEFLNGERIDVDRYADFTPNSCHQEVKLHLIGKTARNEEESMRPLVSIVILNTNGRREIEACLDSIARNTPESHEVIVLDNGSTDGSTGYLRTRIDVTLIESPVNMGVAPGRARAMAHARGKHIVLLDNDTVVTEDWITKFLAHIDLDPKIGVIGPRSNYVSGMQVVPGAKYGSIAELEEFAREWCAQQSNQPTVTLRLVGFCMFVRREVIDKIGSIDASFGKFGFEDDDYTIRANIAGFKTIIANNVFVHHTGGPQGQGNSEYNTLLMNAWKRFQEKWGIPMETPYGGMNAGQIASRPFEVSKHFIPLMSLDSSDALDLSFGSATERQTEEITISEKKSAEDHFKKALAHEGVGSIELAMEELQRALEIDHKHAGAHNGLGVLYYRNGDVQKAYRC